MSEFFAHVESKAGLNRLPNNPCKLLDFQLLVLPAGEIYQAQTGDREILAVILGGKATFVIQGQRFERVGQRPNVFAGKPYSVYLPCGADFSIQAEGPVEIALCSAPSATASAPYVIEPSRVNTGVWGAAGFSRNFYEILTTTQQPDLPAQRLIVGETYTPGGHWSTYPPHKHEKDEGGEAFHEEMYFFRVSSPEGFGILRHYDRETFEENYTVRNNTILMAPRGYHTYAGAPGYTSYYLWMLAGNQRTQGVTIDPDLAWVNKTVPMLKDLGY